MIPFRYLSHTADARFQAFGRTLEEALRNSGRALMNLMTDVAKIRRAKTYPLKISSKTKEDLVVDFLQELLFLMEVKGFFMADAQVKVDSKARNLRGTVYGDSIKHYETHGQVKAITYHDLKITEGKKGVMIQVVVDV